MNSKRFCKILESKKYGQILVRLDTNDEGEPCLVMTININDMYVSNSVSGFKDDVTDEQLLECLDDIGMKECESFANQIDEMLNG
ncbi:hypothetical protein [Shewanella chilikensis]|uniref:hypothetical protein n=1 Tax=Shewanella chilikensis TaxID=558541 RepID=UPI003A976A0E